MPKFRLLRREVDINIRRVGSGDSPRGGRPRRGSVFRVALGWWAATSILLYMGVAAPWMSTPGVDSGEFTKLAYDFRSYAARVTGALPQSCFGRDERASDPAPPFVVRILGTKRDGRGSCRWQDGAWNDVLAAVPFLSFDVGFIQKACLFAFFLGLGMLNNRDVVRGAGRGQARQGEPGAPTSPDSQESWLARFWRTDYILGLLPTLGFLGTIDGISRALIEAKDIFAVGGDPSQQTENFAQVIDALGMAFDTTAVALVLAAILRYRYERQANIQTPGPFEHRAAGPPAGLQGE